jgi:hypothetical protein
MAEVKTQKTKASVSAFITAIPNAQQRADAKVLLALFKDATGLKPAMWGTAIVGFGEYHYTSEHSSQKGDWPLTAFSPRSGKLVVYIMPGFADYAPLLEKLGPHKHSISCLYLKSLKGIHLPTLRTLIRRSVAAMKKKYGVA